MRGTRLTTIAAPAGWRGLGRRTLPVLALMLLAAGSSPAGAEETPSVVTPLEEAVRAGGGQPVRFALTSGRIVVGRIVKVGDDVLTIRRPSAGLYALTLPEIASVNIKTTDGELRPGRIVRMADGGIGWLGELPRRRRRPRSPPANDPARPRTAAAP